MYYPAQYYPQEHNYTAFYPPNSPPTYQERPAPGAYWAPQPPPCPPAPQGAWFPSNPPPLPRPCYLPWNPFAVHNYKAASVPFTEDQVRQVFMQFDLNRDNVLSREEIRQAFKYLGAMFPAQKARKALKLADANGDGAIDLSELDDLVKYAYNLGYVVR
ncbi:hypothetical protein P3X46_001160 [Hevea brasiliensis]|uniref:EF-hand domain-containing protein n=1 Tax=Hevea brasiliensis TaxID=3981 RepID=A0ABQ9NE10_HEVBR|nr:hypothetical protein P3X46_001160 [Hevea brasiliensis]